MAGPEDVTRSTRNAHTASVVWPGACARVRRDPVGRLGPRGGAVDAIALHARPDHQRQHRRVLGAAGPRRLARPRRSLRRELAHAGHRRASRGAQFLRAAIRLRLVEPRAGGAGGLRAEAGVVPGTKNRGAAFSAGVRGRDPHRGRALEADASLRADRRVFHQGAVGRAVGAELEGRKGDLRADPADACRRGHADRRPMGG